MAESCFDAGVEIWIGRFALLFLQQNFKRVVVLFYWLKSKINNKQQSVHSLNHGTNAKRNEGLNVEQVIISTWLDPPIKIKSHLFDSSNEMMRSRHKNIIESMRGWKKVLIKLSNVSSTLTIFEQKLSVSYLSYWSRCNISFCCFLRD